MTYKNIRIKKKGGGTRMQRVRVLASGKYRFVKNLGRKIRRKSKSRPKTRRAKTSRRKTSKGSNRMGKTNIAQQVKKWTKIAALVGPAAYQALRTDRNPQDKVAEILYRYTGFWIKDGHFNAGKLVEGWGPYVAVNAVQKGVELMNRIIRAF